jgi:uncharacterized membrane protein
MNKRIKVFIIFSVVLNVLFIGLCFGFVLKHNHHYGYDKSVAAILENAPIPENRRLFLVGQINTIFESGWESHKDIEQMRELAFQILTAPTFDEVAYQEQIDKIFEIRSQQKKNISEKIKNLATQLDAKERLALAEILRNMQKKRGS